MSEKIYPTLQHLPDGLDKRLKEIDSLRNSIQNLKDIKIFIIMKLKSIKPNLRHKIFQTVYFHLLMEF